VPRAVECLLTIQNRRTLFELVLKISLRQHPK